jgi:hypothetical protein
MPARDSPASRRTIWYRSSSAALRRRRRTCGLSRTPQASGRTRSRIVCIGSSVPASSDWRPRSARLQATGWRRIAATCLGREGGLPAADRPGTAWAPCPSRVGRRLSSPMFGAAGLCASRSRCSGGPCRGCRFAGVVRRLGLRQRAQLSRVGRGPGRSGARGLRRFGGKPQPTAGRSGRPSLRRA